MSEFTLEDMKRILREHAGEEESANLDGDILDANFTDLGYDSLALLQTSTLIEREFNVTLPDEGLHTFDTPAKLIALVNQHLTVTS
ncbi:acyl carrier protein [Streptomyces rishiriensis]|uniref:acyl carrier protein n=1 Tax=Streptomyces rishiriensis TaxID=68264 RepID=UPI000D58E641|nr:acyl carrier protein [Streptomyces rishiriensis]